MAALDTANAATQPAVPPASAKHIQAGADGAVHLPAGVDLNEITVSGDDLVVQLPDGTVLVIDNGAQNPPELVIDGVVIPAVNVAALITDQQPEPAAGTTSSGGNFVDPVGDIGPGLGIGDLLPPTGLQFSPPEFEEIFQLYENKEPTVIIITPDLPVGAPNVNQFTSDAGLSGGSQQGSGIDETSGTITFTPGNEPATVTIDGMVVFVGQQIPSEHGYLEITSVASGEIGYTFHQTENVIHPEGSDDVFEETFEVTVTDVDGDSASGSLTINILDDSPVATNDGQLASVDDNASGVTIGTVAGLLSNDSYGADGPAAAGSIVIGAGDHGGTVSIVSGNLVYTSATNITSPFNPVTETFIYTIKDADGDTTTATFSVQLTDGGPSITSAAASISVDEEGLGGNPGAIVTGDLAGEATTASGTLAGLNFGVDGPGNIVLTAVADTGLRTLDGHVIRTVWDGTTHTLTGEDATNGADVFTLQITNVSTGAYSFTLLAPVQHSTANVEDDKTLNIGVVVTDAEGDTANGSVSLLIDDDTPIAANDGQLASVDDNASGVTIGTVAGLLSNDSFGADGQGSPNITIGVGDHGGTVSIVAGNLVYTSATNITDPFNPVTETFTYTIKDGDGDTATATFSVQLTDEGPSINAESASISVDEEGLGGNAGAVVTGDLAGEATTATGNLSGLNFGVDGPGNIVLTAVADTGLRTLDGHVIETVWDGTTHTLTGQDATNGNDVFTLTITNVSTGAYSFTLLAPVQHDTANVEDDKTLNIGVVVTDAEGDTANGSVSLLIDDDTPIAANDGQLASVDDNASGVTIGTVAGLLSNDSYGADGPAAADSIVIGVGDHGGTVSIVGGNLVYTSATNITSPYTPVTETFTYTIKDGDGDTTTATFSVQITDEGPSINELSASISVDEEGLGGNAGAVVTGDLAGEATTASGTLSGLNFGVDGAGDIVLTAVADTGLRTLDGHVIETVWDGTTHTLTGQDATNGNDVFTLQITNVSTGAYSFTLLAPVQHDTANVEDDKTLNIGVVVTDAEGESANGSVSLLIDDDSPTAANDGQLASVDDNASGVTIGTVAGLLSNDSYGADGQGSPNITIGVGDHGGTVSIVGGNLVYTSATNITSPYTPVTETFTYTIKDGDGDTATATFSVQLTDEGPSINAESASISVDEEGLGGNAGAIVTGDLAGEATTASGTLAGLNFGVDGPGNIVLTAVADTGLRTLDGHVIETVWDGTTHTLTGQDATNGNDVFTLTITNVSTGAYSFTLLAPVQHSTANVEDDKTLNIGVVVTDAEGESANGSVSLLIDDDTPIAANDGQLASLDDSASGVTIGTVAGLLSNDSYGADGPAAADSIVIGVGDHGGTVSIVAGNLVYTSNYDVISPFDPVTETFTYTIKDGDGDTTTATFSVQLTDGGPSINTDAASISVDEEGLGGNAGQQSPTTGDLAGVATTASGTLAGLDFGVDGAGDIVLTAVADTGLRTLDNHVIETVWDGTTHTLTGQDATNGNDVFTLTITNVSTGAYSFTLLAPVQHSTANVEDDKTLNIGVVVTDSEGDVANGSVSLLIDDDSPTAANDGQLASVDDNASGVTIGTVAGLLSNDSYGADGPAAADSIVIGVGDHGGTVSIVGGNLLYTSATNITSPYTPVSETFTYTIKDGDGDTITATFSVQITDEGPAIDASSASISVDEEGLGGNAGQQSPFTGDLAGEATTASGTLSGLNFGVDGAGDIVLTAVADTGLRTLDGHVIETVWDGTTHTLTGQDATNGNDVFTLTITNVSTGAYSFTLLAPVQHTTAGVEDDKTLNIGVVVTDAEGESANGSVSLLIDDDSPTAANDGQLASVDDNASGVTIGTVAGLLSNDSYGADGPAAADSIVIGVGDHGGTVSIVAGNLLYTSATNITSPYTPVSETFTYTIKDGDGDTITATFSVQITDEGPAIDASSASISVDEEGLGGNAGQQSPTTGDLAGVATTASGTLAGLNFGVDGAGDIVLTAVADTGLRTLDGHVIETVWDGTTHTLTGQDATNGNDVFTLQITNVSTGAYSFTLLAPVQHDTANVEDDKTLNIGVVVTDAEGESANGSVSLLIDDDSPTAANDGQLASVDDNASGVTIGTVAGLLSNDSYGADGPAAADSITIGVGDHGGTVSIVAGNLVYTSATNITSPYTPVSETFTYTIKDGDGDTITATFSVQITDGGPSITSAAASISVDEEGLSGGNAGQQSPTTGDLAGVATTATGNLAGLSFGVDGAGDVTLTAVADTGLRTLDNHVIETVWDQSTHTLTGQDATNGNDVFTLQITNVSTGAYSFTLYAPVKHTTAGVEDDKTLNIGVVVTDAEGEAATNGVVALTIDDDSPTIGTVQNGTASNDPAAVTLTTGSLHFSAGADGVGSVTNVTLSTTATSGGHGLVTNFSGGVLTAYQDNGNGVYDAGVDTVEVFTLTISPTGGPGGGFYTFDLKAALDGSLVTSTITGGSSFGAGPASVQILTDATPTNLAIVAGWQESGFDTTTWSGTPTFDDINGSVSGWGVGNNNLDVGELIRFDFRDADPGFGAGYIPPAFNGPQIAVATFAFPHFASTDQVWMKIFYEDGSGNPMTPEIRQLSSSEITGGLTISTGSLTKFIDYVEFYDASGNGKVQLVSVGQLSNNVDQTLTFTTTITDGDGDPITSGNFTVGVTTGGSASSATAPIALDLNGDGHIHFVGLDAGVTFDYFGDGAPEATAWVGAEDGLLAIDLNGNGQVDDGSEIIFSVGSSTDLEGLRLVYDTNHDGVLDANDADFAKFGVWQDANQNGVSDDGEFHTLTDLGIVSIDLTSDGQSYTDANGEVQVAGLSTYTMSDDSTGVLADAGFTYTASNKLSDDAARIGQNSGLFANVLAAAAMISATSVGLAAAAATPAAEHLQGLDFTSFSADAHAFTPLAIHQNFAQQVVENAFHQGAQTFQPLANHEGPSTHDFSSLPTHELGLAHAEAHAPVLSQLSGDTHLSAADHIGLAPMIVDAMPVPMLTSPSGAVAQAPQAAPEQVAQVLSDALHGGAQGTSIDDLLSALPAGGHAQAGLAAENFSADAMALSGLSHQAAFTFEAAFLVHHDSTAVTHV